MSDIGDEALDALEGDGDIVETKVDEAISEVLGTDLTWRTNALHLYDSYLRVELMWPALTVAWLDTGDDSLARLVVGQQTDGTEGNELMLVELSTYAVSDAEANTWESWRTELGNVEGFGCNVLDPSPGPLQCVRRWPVPTEVNRVVPSPHRSNLIAARTSKGVVMLFDCMQEDAAAHRTFTGSDPGEGFALSWSRLESNLLATGGETGRLCIWDSNNADLPLYNFTAHDGALCDLSFSAFAPHLVASVGDKDRELRLWDIRSRTSPQSTASAQDELLSVDWNYRRDFLLATAGKDANVCIWDTRAMQAPLRALQGHENEAVVVRWAPFHESILASCSSDCRVNIWDMDHTDHTEEEFDAEDSEEIDAPELIYSHAGHDVGVTDFSWNSAEQYMLASVDEENFMQVWKLSAVVLPCHEDAVGAGEDGPITTGPPAKRAKTDDAQS